MLLNFVLTGILEVLWDNGFPFSYHEGFPQPELGTVQDWGWLSEYGCLSFVELKKDLWVTWHVLRQIISCKGDIWKFNG